MTAWYNEIDPYAAAWLRNLIAAGEIAPGVVDERSIVDVRPSELVGYTQCHFFAGIGVWSLALRGAGWSDDRPVWTGSCPCQPFSAAGKGDGFADERHLWPAWDHLIEQCRPENVFGEQVASKDGLAWLDLVQADMEGADYALWPGDLCAAGFGSPHIRQRLWLVGKRLEYTARDRRFERWTESSGRGALGRRLIGGLDHHHHQGLEGLGRDGSGERGRAGASRSASAPDAIGALADDGRSRLNAGLTRDACDAEGEGGERRDGTARCSRSGPLAVNTSFGQDGRAGFATRQRAPEFRSGIDLGFGELADAGHGQLSQPLGRAQTRNGHGPDRANSGRSAGRPGPTNGPWADADWLLCRDGKWRPVEPGTFPLAHGASSRVGRLRAYGNAIVRDAAEGVISAYLEAEAAGFEPLREIDLVAAGGLNEFADLLG